MKWNNLALGSACAVALLGLAGCPANKSAGGPPPGAGQAAPVQAAPAETRDVPVELTAFGTAEPLASVELKAQVAGEIVEVLFKEGDQVAKGQPLFRLDPKPFEVALAEAEAMVARAEAQQTQAQAILRENQVRARNAQVELERNRTLLAREIVTREEFDQSETAAAALEAASGADAAAVQSAGEEIRAARASVDAAKLDLSYCTIVSPMDGRTGSLMAHPGNLVTANGGNPLVMITQTRPIYVTFTVPEHHLPALRAAMAAGEVVVHAAAPDSTMEPIAGKLVFIDNMVDRVTSTIRLKAEFVNDGEVLWPGQYLGLRVSLGVQPGKTVVPARAVQTSQNGPYVYVVTAENKAESRNVTVGISHDDFTAIEEGVQAGEVVITDGHLRVAPGGAVRVLDGDNAPEAAAE